MPLLTLSNIGHAFGNTVILDGVTMSVEPSEKIGVVGRNGCGKTTLMRVIMGSLEPDTGAVQLMRHARVGYLSQDPEFDDGDTVRDAAETAFAALHELHLQMNVLYEQMANADGSDLQKLLRRQAELESSIEAEGGYAIDHRIDATLHGLGFSDDQFGLPVDVLSGGQKGRLGLARLLLEEPDLLLLDEPTNHLDIDGREWLEGFLAEEYSGAVLVISHDRWLLDRVVDRIVEIELGGARDYPGNYEKFVALRLERKATEARVYEKQRDKVKSEERFIARYKAGQKAKQAKGRQSRLDRFKRDELVDRPTEAGVMKLRLPKVERSGDMVLNGHQLTKRYDDLTLFDRLDVSIMRGERVGIIGPNGAGKSTLVQCLLGELKTDEGICRLGSRVDPGFYRQLHDHLDLDLTVWQYIQSVMAGQDGSKKASEQQARDLGGAFLFSGDEQEKRLGEMSGGERSRAVLAGLVGSVHNLLVLDEPTNHLDIPSAERLEQALTRGGPYGGTLVVITHDRAFLERTCDRLLIFEGDGVVRDFPDTWSAWLRQREEIQTDKTLSGGTDRPVHGGKAKRRAAAQARDEARRDQDGPAGMSTAVIEGRIEEIETRIREIDGLMIDPKVYTDGRKCKILQRERSVLSTELEPLEFEWSRRVDEQATD